MRITGIRAFRDQVLAHVSAGHAIWWMCGPLVNIAAIYCICRITPRKARCAADISPAPRTFHGLRLSTPMALSSQRTICACCMSKEKGLRPDDNVVAYCRIGERSSHTWFVLTYLLGYPQRAQLRRQLD